MSALYRARVATRRATWRWIVLWCLFAGALALAGWVVNR